MIGVKMRIDDVKKSHACGFCCFEIGLDIADRIDHRAGRLATASEQV